MIFQCFSDWRTQSVHLYATIEKQHINKANLHYKWSSDSAKMAVYLSSSWEIRLGSLPKNELFM